MTRGVSTSAVNSTSPIVYLKRNVPFVHTEETCRNHGFTLKGEIQQLLIFIPSGAPIARSPNFAFNLLQEPMASDQMVSVSPG